MSVTRFSDTIVPGGVPASNKADAQPQPKTAGFERLAEPPSHNELLRTAMPLHDAFPAPQRIVADRKGRR